MSQLQSQQQLQQQPQQQQQPNVAPKPATAGPPSAARPYRRFILPALHRRFANAALLSLSVCAIQALWMGRFQSFWHKVGSSTLRTLLLFIPALAIYVLRVANLRVGRRTTTSEFQSLLLYTLSFETLKTLLWYSFSAFFFCEVYIWSSSPDDRLSIVDKGRTWERPRLNERPIFLRSLFLCLAVGQSALHLYFDYDSVPIPVTKPQSSTESLRSRSQQPFWVSLLDLRQNLVPIATRSFFRTLVTTFTAPLAYWIFIRHTAWSWSFWLARLVFELPKSSRNPAFPPLIVDLLGRFLVQGFLLVFAWEFANTAFDTFLAREPMKQGRLLTDESQDPNGSLLNGMQTTRPIPRNFAFWELFLIANYMDARRQSIYSEIGRPGGSTWAKVLTVCLGELHAVVKRIQTFEAPPKPPDAQSTEQTLRSLPKISAPVKEDNIFKSSPSARKPTRFDTSKTDRLLTSSTTKLLTYTSEVLPHEQNKNVSKDGLLGSAQSLLTTLLRLPVGVPFRQTFARRACSIAFVSPHSNLNLIVDSIISLTKFAVHSKKEDTLGTVYRDVPNIIRTFTSTHNTIESFIKRLSVHWTDVYFTEPRKVEDLDKVMSTLRECLKDLIDEFSEYSDDMKLSAAEIRQAKLIINKTL